MVSWVPGRCPACNKLLVRDGLVRCGRCGAALVAVTVSLDTPSPTELGQVIRWIRSITGGQPEATEYNIRFQDGRPAGLFVVDHTLLFQEGPGEAGLRVGVRDGRPVDLTTGKALDAHRVQEILGIKELTPRR